MDPTRVLLVDDLVMLAEALAVRLSALPDLVLLGCYRTSDQDLPQQVARLCPDVTVVDVEPTGSAAGDLVTAVRHGWPAGHVVVLTGSTDLNLAVAVARAGADAWVDKTSSLDHLIEVMRGVCCGCAWWPPRQLGSVLHSLRLDAYNGATTSSGTLDSLSPRERQVLLAIIAGDGQDVIGRELAMSVHMVRAHASRIFAKLRVYNRAPAASGVCGADSLPAPAGGVHLSDHVVDVTHRGNSPKEGRSMPNGPICPHLWLPD